MSQTISAPSETRIAAIDELRGLAFLAVLASHLGLIYGLDSTLAYALALPAFGVGVDLFFVIAGFCAARSFQVLAIQTNGNWKVAAGAFWLRRGIRIVPPAWVVLIAIAFIRHWLVRDHPSNADLITAASFAANFHWAFCSINNLPCPGQMLSGHFWSLALEMQFYLIAPLLLITPRRIAFPIGVLFLIFGVTTPRPVGGLLWSVRPEGFLLGLALGRARPTLPRIALAHAVYWLFVAAIFERIAQRGFFGASLTIVAIVFAFVLAGRLGGEPASGNIAALLRWIGRGSYAAYLVHLPALAATRDLTLALLGPTLSMTTALLAIYALSIIVEIVIVRPAADFGRRASNLFIIINCESLEAA